MVSATIDFGWLIGLFAALAAATAFAGIAPAVASKPVPKTIVGCITNGSFVSSDSYEIHPTTEDGQAVDLPPFEGRQVTISGDLLPGAARTIQDFLPQRQCPAICRACGKIAVRIFPIETRVPFASLKFPACKAQPKLWLRGSRREVSPITGNLVARDRYRLSPHDANLRYFLRSSA